LKTHAEHLAELPAGAGEELLQLFAWAEKEIGARGGGIAMRFGDTRYSAGTVRHLHGMFIVPDVDAPDFQPVRVKIGKN
jgi:diadenosine tetraphosphate (Ap4A) HIT family hydrolase